MGVRVGLVLFVFIFYFLSLHVLGLIFVHFSMFSFF